MIDLHAHILPGVDDGAASLKVSCAMLDMAQDAGVTGIVATPHILLPGEPLTQIQRAYEALLPHANRRNIALYQGYEVNIGAARDTAANIEGLWFSRGEGRPRYLLLELNRTTDARTASFLVSELSERGITPVLAHVERYAFVQQNVRNLLDVTIFGALTQVDAGALCGMPFGAEQRCAQRLLKAGLVDCIASDAHRPADYLQYGSVMRSLKNPALGAGFF